MATKAELETAFTWCNSQLALMEGHVTNHDYFGAIDVAVASLGKVHNSVSYQRRYLSDMTPSVQMVDHLLGFAPCFFNSHAIEQVALFYKGGTKTEKDAISGMPQKLDFARKLLARSVELWGRLSEGADAQVGADSSSAQDSTILKLWCLAGLLYLVLGKGGPTYAKVTNFARIAAGKCFRCGALHHAPTPGLAAHAACPSCRRMTDFAILNRRSEG